MKDYDVFVAVLMQKTVLDVQNGIFLYRTIDIMDDGEMDFSTNMFIHHKTGIKYFSMESEEAVLSENEYFYAFPISKQDLKNDYPNIDSEQKRLKEYFDELNRYVYFGIFDSKSGIKTIQVWKEALTKMKIEANMEEFTVLYEEGLDEHLVLLPSSNIMEIIKLLDKNKLERLKLYFHFLNEHASNEFQEMKNFSDKATILLNPTTSLEPKEETKNAGNISFSTLKENKSVNLTPINVLSAYEEIKKKVVGQDETIKKVLTAIRTNDLAKDSSYRSRCLIVGKTGCGKTEILRNLGKIAGRPFVRTDSTQITIAGYVGGSIENNILMPLIQQANGNIELAQRGIVALDEIDKKGSSNNEDIAGRGVLNSFLPFLDGTEYPLMVNGKKVLFDTSSLTVFAGGAFSNVFDYSTRKMKRIGVRSQREETINKKEIDIEDFIKIGLMPDEFMGRFPILAFMNELSESDFETILIKPETSPLSFYERLFYEHYHIALRYDDNFIKLFARKAYKHKIGARALQKIAEEVLEECRWEIYSQNIHDKELILNEKTIENPKKFILK